MITKINLMNTSSDSNKNINKSVSFKSKYFINMPVESAQVALEGKKVTAICVNLMRDVSEYIGSVFESNKELRTLCEKGSINSENFSLVESFGKLVNSVVILTKEDAGKLANAKTIKEERSILNKMSKTVDKDNVVFIDKDAELPKDSLGLLIQKVLGDFGINSK